MTGTPVKELRRGGMIEWDWVVGARIRRRRGLGMFLALGVALAAGLLGAGEVIVVEPRVGNGRLDCAIAF